MFQGGVLPAMGWLDKPLGLLKMLKFLQLRSGVVEYYKAVSLCIAKDAACCYSLCSVVCLSVGHDRELCENG